MGCAPQNIHGAELGHPLLAETALCQKVFWTSEVLVYYEGSTLVVIFKTERIK